MSERTLLPYHEYEDSGQVWLDEIPAHWEMRRAKWLFERMDRAVRPEDETITCFRDGEVTLRKNRRTQGFTESLKEIGYQGIRKGDLVIHQMDAFAGAVGVSDSDGKGSPVYSVCQPKEGVDARYFARVVGEMARSEYIAALATGIRERSTDFRYSTFSNQEVPLPPLPEQRRISRYLDDLTRRIDRLIGAKERLIALLEEQKQGIIQRAVTRGLDSDAEMKPSGVDWLGEVPAHWEVRKLKYACEKIVGGATPTSSVAANWGGDVVWATPSDISQAEEIDKTSRTLTEAGLKSCSAVVVPAESVVLTSRAPVGNVALAKVPLCTNQGCKAVVPKPNTIGGTFCYYLLRSAKSELQASATGTTFDEISTSKTARLKIPLPPFHEQQHIVTHIMQRTIRIDAAIEKAQSEIALIREYRTRLISNVVTGKLDVASPPQPQPRRQKPTKKHAKNRAPVAFRRSTVAAGITDRLRSTRGFGRVQLQKALVVSERHLELDLGIKAKRDRLGPFDNNAMRSVHSQFRSKEWFNPVKQHGAWRYDALPKLGEYKKYFDGFIHSRTEEFKRLMHLFGKMDAEQSEIVATLYMAWNDELIEGHAPSNEKLLDEVLNNWHPSKKKFSPSRWQGALAWMRDPERGNLIPTGFGPSTKAN